VLISIRASMRPVRGSDVNPLKWAFEEGARLGFDGLELCMAANRNSFVTFWSDELKAETKALSQEYGVSVISLSSDWAWAYAAFFPDFKDWGKGAELIAEDAKLTKELGGNSMLIHMATSKGSWEDCKAALTDCAAAGEQYGIKMGYEANIWERTNLGGYDGLIRMVDEIGSDYFGVYLHNSYPRAGLPLQDEITKAGDRLTPSMHSSDLSSDRVQIDWEKAIPALKQYFADGAYTFEISWDVAEANKKIIDEAIAKYW
jgi:sugar phosphate isomerase/epimerase